MEGLIFGILRYLYIKMTVHLQQLARNKVEGF